MKKPYIYLVGLVALLPFCIGNSGCGDANTEEQNKVLHQQDVYGKNQPPPVFEWSLPRDLWIKFYNVQNQQVSTWSYILPITGGQPLFETPSQGYPIPMDSQLTNPLQRAGESGAAIDQAEPNGLFTSKNSDATIIFATNDNGTVSPVYTEMKVTCFSFPVRWEGGKWIRIKEAAPSISLKVGKDEKK